MGQLLVLFTIVIWYHAAFEVDGWLFKQQQRHQRSIGRISRRKFGDLLSTIVIPSIIVATPIALPKIVHAAESSTSIVTEIQQRLPLGHARVKYLLDHWDDVTSVCGTVVMSDLERKQIIRTEGGGGGGGGAAGAGGNDNVVCNKTPLRVQEFMGYKSTKDPLYKIDKLLIRAGNVVDPDQYEDYISTVEEYRTTADATALLAYTSSWGEANPNGSKEVIDDYLDQTKAQVIESEKLLRNMLRYLNLQPLPPLQGKL